MTLPEGATPEKIVKALRPGAECVRVGAPKSGPDVFIIRDIQSRFIGTVRATPPDAWWRAAEMIAGEDPEGFVRAVFPEAWCGLRLSDACYRIHLIKSELPEMPERTEIVAWHSAAQNILDELRKGKP